ncbi:Uncharacterised protein [uncultured Roseburia sp.]|nr:Uncharacterised protein [uncultured Roseburia sp.]
MKQAHEIVLYQIDNTNICVNVIFYYLYRILLFLVKGVLNFLLNNKN